MTPNKFESLQRFWLLLALAAPLGLAACEDDDEKAVAEAGVDAAVMPDGAQTAIDAPMMEADADDEDAEKVVLDVALADVRVPTPAEVFESLNGLRWELPCSNNFNGYCDTPEPQAKETHLSGPSGAQYDVTLRFRGVVEEKSYADGVADGHWLVGGAPASDLYNVYQLTITNPPQVYFLNNGESNRGYCVPIDVTKTLRLAAGATVTLTADPIDTAQVENGGDNGMPVVVPGVPPAPAHYDGQFIQMDVVMVKQVQ
jgi:hypothetical protein